MNKILLRPLLLIIILLLPQYYYAQSPQENLEKYWNYRDRLKKYFVKLGADQGEGVMLINRCSVNHPLGSSCFPCAGVGLVKWADGVIWTGYYLSVLATEYALLKENNDSTDDLLKELYDVINALDRLDLEAERYLSKGAQSPTRNGFFIRDDVPEDFQTTVDHWSSDYDCMSSDYASISSTEPGLDWYIGSTKTLRA